MLPKNHNLPIEKLGRVFDKTTATYKFYWLISILDLFVLKNKEKMSVWEIVAEMMGNAWYPIHYFHLSFGKLDSLDKQVRQLHRATLIPISATKEEVVNAILQNDDMQEMKKIMRVFTQNVPFRFLRPWINTSDNPDTVRRSQNYENDCLYSLTKDANNDLIITINPHWYNYLRKNYNILHDFAYWNLVSFIQSRNPNVPNITNKLIKPLERNSLSRQRAFWNQVITQQNNIHCIYTGKLLTADDYDLDHFIPWSFVAHDQIWNLIPADSSINSSKSNKLPDLDIYLHKLALEHQNAVRIMYDNNRSDKLLEDYCTIIDNPYDLIAMERGTLLEVFSKTFKPLYQIASNMSFETWKYNL